MLSSSLSIRSHSYLGPVAEGEGGKETLLNHSLLYSLRCLYKKNNMNNKCHEKIFHWKNKAMRMFRMLPRGINKK